MLVALCMLPACSNSEYDFDNLFPEAYHKVLSIANDQVADVTFSDQTDTLEFTVKVLKGGSNPQLQADAELIPMTKEELVATDSSYLPLPQNCYTLKGANMHFEDGEKSKEAEIGFQTNMLKELVNSANKSQGQYLLGLKLSSANTTVNSSKDKILIRMTYQEPTNVNISLDVASNLGEVSPYLTGFNMSYYHDTDQLWADGRLITDLKNVKTRLLRYPGGNETSYYHWQYPGCPGYLDVWNPDHKSKIEETIKIEDTRSHATPYMDTDEFIAVCRKVGAEPFLGVNILSGIQNNKEAASLQEAVDWVKYCKEKGYNVKYWYLDNEVNSSGAYGRTLYAADYAKYIEQYAKAMRAVDPDIKLVANLMYTSLDDKKQLVDLAGAYFDILELHFYYGWDTATWDSWRTQMPMADPSTYTDMINELAAYISRSAHPNIELASLEWNVRPSHNPVRPSDYQQMMMQAEMLGQFVEANLRYACVWPLVWSTDKGYFPTIIDQKTLKTTPTYELFRLYGDLFGQQRVGNVSSDNSQIAQTVVSKDGRRAWILAVNKASEEVKANISLQNGTPMAAASARIITTANVEGDYCEVKDVPVAVSADKTTVSVVVPPYSVYRVSLSF